MAELKYKKKRRDDLPLSQRYSEVDVWKATFGPISVVAIFDVYSQKFKIPFYEARKLKFTDCVEALRKLQDPEYVCWKDK